MTDIYRLIADERRSLVADLRELDEQQWLVPSLCTGWTVRDVLGHLVTPFTAKARHLIWAAARNGGLARGMDALARERGKRPTDELIGILEARADSHFRPPGMPAEAPLTDTVVHGCDMRIPLGLPTVYPPESILRILSFLTSPKAALAFVPKARIAGLSITTTDMEFEFGKGDQVSGPGLSIALALLGRAPRIADLGGPGAPKLAHRITS